MPEGHLAHHISDLVDDLDLTAFYAPYEGDGRRNAPYEPRMMVKVLLYAYATGVFSSRRVARKLEEDVAFRVLAAGNFPQHRTLCEFRRRHLEDFQSLFVEVVRLAQELGLARLGKLSIDGTKVRANASKHKAMSYDRMQEEEQRLESEIEALLRQADAVDEAEDARLGAEVRGDDLPAELRRREERLAAIRALRRPEVETRTEHRADVMPLEVLVLLFAAVTACVAADLFDAGAPVHRAAVSALLVLFLLEAVYAVLNVAHRVGAEGAIPREGIAGWCAERTEAEDYAARSRCIREQVAGYRRLAAP